MRKLSVRAAVAAVLGLLLGTIIYSYYEQWSGRGIDAYLHFQSLRFDRKMAHPNLVLIFVEQVFLVLLAVTVYELVVAAVWKFAKPGQS